MKTYQVFLKPCEQYPEGSLCIDPSYIRQDTEDKDGYAVFYKKKSAQKLIDYLCSTEWAADSYTGASNKQEDYEIVCSHDVRYCVWYAGKACTEGLCVDIHGNPFDAASKKEAKAFLKDMAMRAGVPEEMYVVVQLLVPKKKVS